MAVLMSGGGAAGGPNGGERRCDGTCHNAKHSTCVCICGGRYHGKGTTDAFKEHQTEVEAGVWGEGPADVAKILKDAGAPIGPPIQPLAYVEVPGRFQQRLLHV